MGREIERKFLLADDSWRQEVTRSTPMQQGYLAGNERASVRVRLEGAHARLNIKSATLGIERLEYEYELPVADAEEMLAQLCGGRRVEKTRHYVERDGLVWEIDEFAGANAGLVVAELELDAADSPFTLPPWAGAEVSDDPRYYNVQLIEKPYNTW